ncbi:MAG: ferredoxin--NADP reductase [Acidobacteriota bacterium]|nr:ferredoxin--NADP reductase [Acidobacteriota bacterium]
MNPETHLRAEISARRDLSPDLWIIRVRPERRLIFRPGQFATLALPAGEKLVERPYSIASCPLEPELEFFLELVHGGRLTERLHPLQPGDPVYVRKTAKGSFTLDEESGHRTHLMIATVTGVAPFVSMVRTMQHVDGKRGGGHRVILLQGASRSWELGYEEELSRMKQDTTGFRYVPTVSRPAEDPSWQGQRGRVHEIIREQLEAVRFDSTDTTAYLCGHPGMIAAAREILAGAGLDGASIREERFWVPGL